jgi:hypothetical protein
MADEKEKGKHVQKTAVTLERKSAVFFAETSLDPAVCVTVKRPALHFADRQAG